MFRDQSIIPHSSPWLTQDDEASVIDVLKSGMIAEGSLCEEFENSCGKYLGTLAARVAGSGQAALGLALRTVGVSAGDEVILPSYVCEAVLHAILSIGAVPVFCDVGSDWCIDSKSVEPHLSGKTGAVIVVHTFGIHADISAFKELNVPIVEDCCQYFGKRMGANGDISAFSFHATKCMTTGEGGLVATGKNELAARLSKIAECTSARISDIQAALGLSQLSRYEEMLARRAAIAEYYLDNLPMELTARIRAVAERSMFFRFPLQIDGDFEGIRSAFYDRGVHVRKGVDALLHRKFGAGDDGFNQSVSLFEETLSIPIYPALSDEDVERTVVATKEILG